MTSYTLAEGWPLKSTPLDFTGHVLDHWPKDCEERSIGGDDSTSSTMISDFLNIFRRFPGQMAERTEVEGELCPAAPIATDRPCPANQAEEDDELELIASQRVALLARQYVRGQQQEDEARFAILTERLNKLLPPVTETEWKKLDEIAERINATADRHSNILDRLGLE